MQPTDKRTELFRVIENLFTFLNPVKSGSFSQEGTHILMSSSKPLVAKIGILG